MSRDFVKMHGLGNDFVIIDGRADGFVPDKDFCLAVADRHRGVGYDQLIVLSPPRSAGADLFVHMFNADGSTLKACGNGSRCVAALLFKETGKREGIIETIAGPINVWKTEDGLYAVDFGPPRLDWKEIPLAQEMDTLSVPLGQALGRSDIPPAVCVSVGNPHAVHFVPDAMAIAMEEVGPKLEHHPLFPDRCNIEFAHIIDRLHIRMRVWERGAGLTEACGTGASATLVAAVRRSLTERKAVVHLDGGDLTIEWREADGHVILMGPVALSFTGTWEGA